MTNMGREQFHQRLLLCIHFTHSEPSRLQSRVIFRENWKEQIFMDLNQNDEL